MAKKGLNIVILISVLICGCTEKLCLDVYNDFDAVFTEPFPGNNAVLRSSGGLRFNYHMSKGNSYVEIEQKNCPTEILLERSLLINFELSGLGIAARFTPDKRGNKVTLIQILLEGSRDKTEHVLCFYLEDMSEAVLDNRSYTQVSNPHYRYQDLELEMLDSVELVGRVYKDVYQIKVKDDLRHDDRLIRSYYLHKTFGICGFEQSDGTLWSLY